MTHACINPTQINFISSYWDASYIAHHYRLLMPGEEKLKENSRAELVFVVYLEVTFRSMGLQENVTQYLPFYTYLQGWLDNCYVSVYGSPVGCDICNCTGQQKHRNNAGTRLCLEWDSN